jgi:magnesium chelatase family protein
VSLAHNGVLFLDELPEFRRHVLEALREPLEERAVTISRARGSIRVPARFQLVAAMNPCPCGGLGERSSPCQCPFDRVRAYRARLSGPLLDRIDLHVEVPALPYRDLSGPPGEPSAQVVVRVAQARARQAARTPTTGALANADLDGAQAREQAGREPETRRLLAQAVDRLGLSGRGHDRLLRVARTLADLEGEPVVQARHIAEGLQFRRPAVVAG